MIMTETETKTDEVDDDFMSMCALMIFDLLSFLLTECMCAHLSLIAYD